MNGVPSQRWIEQQRSKPSFVVAGKDSHDVYLENALSHTPAAIASTKLPPPSAYQSSPADVLNIPAAARSIASSSPRRAATPTLSSRSAKSPSRALTPSGKPLPIHEQLLLKGRLYEQHLEGMREKAIQGELRRCRSIPKISPMGHNIERETAIETRLINVFNEKTQVAAFDMQILMQREKAIMDKWFHPTISSKGRRAAGKARKDKQKRLHETWEFKRQQRVEELRREKIVKEMQEMRGTPDIDTRSQLLAARRREKEGMAGYTHLEAMLERDRLAKLARWEEQQRQELNSTYAAPRITEFAATMHRNGDVADRLMEEAAAREERRLERERRRLEEEQRAVIGGSGATHFEPDQFLKRHQQFVQRRDEKIRNILEAEKRMHTPTINPTSDHIAARLSESTMERLMTPPRARTPSRLDASQRQQTPTRSETPGRTARPSEDDSRMFDRLQLAEARRKLRMEAARSEQAAKELEECTFAPQTTTNYYPPQNSAVSAQPDSVYDRMRQWQARREERILEQRRQEAEAASRELTFAPTLNHHQSNNSVQRGTASEAVPGYEEYIARQEAIRHQRALEAASAQHPSDASIRRTPTTPVAPALGRDRDSSRAPVVLSLQRPVGTPSLSAVEVSSPSNGRFSLTGPQVVAHAAPLAQHLVRSHTRNENETRLPAAIDTVSLDTDEQYPTYDH